MHHFVDKSLTVGPGLATPMIYYSFIILGIVRGLYYYSYIGLCFLVRLEEIIPRILYYYVVLSLAQYDCSLHELNVFHSTWC